METINEMKDAMELASMVKDLKGDIIFVPEGETNLIGILHGDVFSYYDIDDDYDILMLRHYIKSKKNQNRIIEGMKERNDDKQ